jgi:glycosyltransferase involved in cell wall biosynthesis
MDKISIIVPVFNSEPYLKKCLDSIVGQTYSNLEILCIDDGSTDNSVEICNEYAANDGRVQVIAENIKGGSGTPVRSSNKGLEIFTGQYLGFVDPDDWLELDMYEVLYNAIKRENVDISVVRYFKFNEGDSKSIPTVNRKQIHADIIPPADMVLCPLQRDYYLGFCGYMWNKLFSARVFKDKNLRFRKDIRYGSDVLLYTEIVLANMCGGVYVDKPLYHYLQRQTAISKSKIFDVKKDILTAYKCVEKLLNDYGYSDSSYWARGFYCHHASVFAEAAIENGDSVTLRLMQTEIQKHLEDYIKTNREFPEKFERINTLLRVKI